MKMLMHGLSRTPADRSKVLSRKHPAPHYVRFLCFNRLISLHHVLRRFPQDAARRQRQTVRCAGVRAAMAPGTMRVGERSPQGSRPVVFKKYVALHKKA
jgi:hypothetical protein